MADVQPRAVLQDRILQRYEERTAVRPDILVMTVDDSKPYWDGSRYEVTKVTLTWDAFVDLCGKAGILDG